jgi:large subunit ribosomal protein L21
MFAIIRVSGKQYRVEDGQTFLVDRLDAEEGTALSGVEVLMVTGEAGTKVGAPLVDGVTVDATVVRHTLGKKINGFKYKAKKNYRRRFGARAHQTLVKINTITA